MAFLNKVIDGGEILLKIDGVVQACSTSHTIELTNAVREISCKGSGDFTQAEYGRFSWTVSTDALLNLGKDSDLYVSYATLMSWMLAKATVSIESLYVEDYGTDNDAIFTTGNCIITSISQVAGDNENASYSMSLQGTGTLAINEGEILNAPVLGGTPAVMAATTANLTWTDVNTAPNELFLQVEYREDTASVWTVATSTVAANSLTYQVTGLTASTDYKFRVVALGNGTTIFDSENSNIEDGTTTI